MKKYFFIYYLILSSLTSTAQCISGNCENGRGFWNDFSGFTYKGQFSNDGEITGKGILTYSSTFKSGQKVGKYIVSFPEAKQYKGYLKKGVPNGKGTLTYRDGTNIKGVFKNGKIISGSINFPNGDILRGKFKNQMLNGNGEIDYANGNKYVGLVNDNTPDGNGVMYFPSGGKDIGFWKKGVFITGSIKEDYNIIQLKMEHGVFIIQVYINGVPVDMVLDTGASIISLTPDILLPAIRNGDFTEQDIIGGGHFLNADGELNPKIIINIREIKVGNFTLENVKAAVANIESPNLLGLNFLKNTGKSMKLNFIKNELTFE